MVSQELFRTTATRSRFVQSPSNWALLVSVLLLALGLGIYFSLDSIIAKVIYQKLNLMDEDSEIYQKWIKNSVPLSLRVYVFEETNPDEIWKGMKPKLREKGPYVFREYRDKRVLSKSLENSSITYSQYKVFYFNESQSIGPLDDKIFTLNVPTVAIAKKLGAIADKLPLKSVTSIPVEMIGDSLFKAHKEELMAEMTVDELLFKGQKVKILETIQTIWTPLELIGIKFPSTGLTNNTYGLFYGQNATFQAPIEVHGIGEQLGMLISHDNQRQLNIWPGEECNKIKGTDGSINPPFLDSSKLLYVFVPDMCRYISFQYKGNIIFHGITAYRYIISDLMFASKYRSPENQCFCNSDEFPCNIDGLGDLGPCKSDAPIYLSNPHFLNASKIFLDSVEGLSPNASLHQSYIDIEPTTGTPIRARVRLQINVFVKRFPLIKTLSDINKETVYPLAWIEQSAEIDDNLAQEIKSKLIRPLEFAHIFRTVFLILALSFFWMCVIWKWNNIRNRRKKTKTVMNSEPQRLPARRNSEFVPPVVTPDTYLGLNRAKARRYSEYPRYSEHSGFRTISPKTNKVTSAGPQIIFRNNYT